MTDIDIFQEPRVTAPKRRISIGTFVLAAGILVVAVTVAIALSRTQPLTSGEAPTFTVTTFDGQTIDLADQRGKVVVLNFWASWCAPCREETPALQAIWEQYRDRDVLVVGIAWADIDEDTLAFIDEFDMTYPNAPDISTRVGDDYLIRAVPETYIIDQDGMIVRRLIGAPEVNVDNLSSILDNLLAG